MEAIQLKTIDDLLDAEDERVELLNGELVKRPMARFDHALIQSCLSDEVASLKRQSGVGGLRLKSVCAMTSITVLAMI